jgi:hypothetical protein
VIGFGGAIQFHTLTPCAAGLVTLLIRITLSLQTQPQADRYLDR